MYVLLILAYQIWEMWYQICFTKYENTILKRQRCLKFMEYTDFFMLPAQCHGWWRKELGHHGIDLVLLVFSGFTIRRVKESQPHITSSGAASHRFWPAGPYTQMWTGTKSIQYAYLAPCHCTNKYFFFHQLCVLMNMKERFPLNIH